VNALRALAAAFSGFSIFPLGRCISRGAPDSTALAALPFVGTAIGGCAGVCALLLGRIAGDSVAVVVAFGIGAVLSGGIHLDGFLDSCDALFAEVDVEQRLAILKDPHHGSFAVVGIALLVPVWLASLHAVPMSRLPVMVAFAATASRWAAIVPALYYRDPRHNPNPALATSPPALVVAATGGGLVLLSAMISPFAWIALLAGLITGVVSAAFAARRLDGGLVGDVYGFIISVCEPVVILLSAITLPRST
jgi:adenosylcobinamide-GDP ribazoletransferase